MQYDIFEHIAPIVYGASITENFLHNSLNNLLTISKVIPLLVLSVKRLVRELRTYNTYKTYIRKTDV